MGLKIVSGRSESRFAAYVEAMISALGHADRAAPFRSHCTGLLLPGDRKSVEPMAVKSRPTATLFSLPIATPAGLAA